MRHLATLTLTSLLVSRYRKKRRTVRINRMVSSYGAVSMVGEIGGYSGLLLGISAFQIASLAGSALEKRSAG